MDDFKDPLISLAPQSQQSTADAEPVTIFVARKIKQGHEKNFERALGELRQILESQSGFSELKAYQPANSKDEHMVVIKFEDAAHLARWQESPKRIAWLQSVKPLEAETPHTQIHIGLNDWLALPDQEGLAPPPRYKMAIVSWLGIFPIILIVNYTITPHLKSWPAWASSGMTSIVLVTLMQTGVLPLMTRLTSKFLYPEVRLTK